MVGQDNLHLLSSSRPKIESIGAVVTKVCFYQPGNATHPLHLFFRPGDVIIPAIARVKVSMVLIVVPIVHES
jgi:hypothetical protein